MLRRARPGEKLILASHTPFTRVGAFKEYGPIYLLAAESDEPVRRDSLRIGAETDYLSAQFVSNEQ